QDADVDRMIEVLRNQQATWAAVERPAASGDRVNIDFLGRRDGEAFEGGTAKGSELVLGSGRMVPGFEAGIEGMAAGETRTIDITMPEDYHAEALKGAAVQFEITVNSVSARELPELEDGFFQRFGVTQGGMDAFRVEVRSNMERELRQALRNKLKARVLDSLLERTEVEVPLSLVAQEIVSLRRQALRQFGADESRFDPSLLPDDMFRAQANRRVSLGLVLGEVIRREKLSADPARVRSLVEETASTYEEPQEVINWYYGNREQLASIEAVALEEQAIEAVLGRASVVDTPCSYEDALRADPPKSAG
ncbi:MAG: trigger factor, partial [Gammaproteobacteria bacterium]